MPNRDILVLLKSPRTVLSLATCIARSWWEPDHWEFCSEWQFIHTSRPINSTAVASNAIKHKNTKLTLNLNWVDTIEWWYSSDIQNITVISLQRFVFLKLEKKRLYTWIINFMAMNIPQVIKELKTWERFNCYLVIPNRKTVRYLGFEVDDALEMAEQTEVKYITDLQVLF